MNSAAPATGETGGFVSEAALRRLKKRHAAEMRFKLYGQMAIGIAVIALITLLISIFGQASSAFSRHVLTFDTVLDAEQVDPSGERDPNAIARNVSGFNLLLQGQLASEFLPGETDRARLRELYGMFTRLAVLPVARKTADNPSNIGTGQSFTVALADDIDLYLKGAVSERTSLDLGSVRSSGGNLDDGIEVSFSEADAGEALQSALAAFRARSEGGNEPAALIALGPSWFRLTGIEGNTAALAYLTGPPSVPQPGTQASAIVLEQSQENRTVTDRQIAWTAMLRDQDRIKALIENDGWA